MKKISILLLSLTASVASSVYAAASVNDATITNLRVRPNVTYVKFAECAYYARIYYSNEYYKSMYATALAAFTADKRVDAVFTAGGDCNTAERTFEFLDIKR